MLSGTVLVVLLLGAAPRVVAELSFWNNSGHGQINERVLRVFTGVSAQLKAFGRTANGVP
eukprot:4087485-Pleurochrysis_carterae.AAC.1